MLNWNHLVLVVVACLVTEFAGCDADNVGRTSTIEVEGRVLLDGQPVKDAKVVFIPFKSYDATGHALGLSYATTDAQGEFTLRKANGDVGAEFGLHRVIVSKSLSVDSTKEDSESSRPLEEVLPNNGIQRGQFWRQPEGELIPVIYNQQSILTFDVSSSKEKLRANFDLSSVDPLLETEK